MCSNMKYLSPILLTLLKNSAENFKIIYDYEGFEWNCIKKPKRRIIIGVYYSII